MACMVLLPMHMMCVIQDISLLGGTTYFQVSVIFGLLWTSLLHTSIHGIMILYLFTIDFTTEFVFFVHVLLEFA